MRGLLVVLAGALGFAALAWQVHPVLAAVPMIALGVPAGLMAWATWRHGDPYDVSHRYPPGAYLGRSVGTDD